MINKAEHRMFISSLYIGSDESELVIGSRTYLSSLSHLISRYLLYRVAFERSRTYS